MATLDIAAVQKKLRELDQRIEELIGPLQEERETLNKEYLKFLRSELASIGGAAPKGRDTRTGSALKIQDSDILDWLRKAQIEQSAQEIREGAELGNVSAQTLSLHLKALVSSGVITKIGERRQARYAIR